MKVKTLLNKAIKIAKDSGIDTNAISFVQKIDLSEHSESLELLFFDKDSNFTTTVYDFQENFNIDTLLINFEASVKKYVIGDNDNKDLEL